MHFLGRPETSIMNSNCPSGLATLLIRQLKRSVRKTEELVRLYSLRHQKFAYWSDIGQVKSATNIFGYAERGIASYPIPNPNPNYNR